MIRPLRRRHLRTLALLTLVLPAGFAAALLARPAPPVIESMPPGFGASQTIEGASSIVVLEGLISEREVEAWIAVKGDTPWLFMVPRSDLRRPDVLLYAARESAATTDSGLPEGAILLGTLAGTRERSFRLPAWVFDSPARLVLYSLAHQEVVGTGKLPVVER